MSFPKMAARSAMLFPAARPCRDGGRRWFSNGHRGPRCILVRNLSFRKKAASEFFSPKPLRAITGAEREAGCVSEAI
jgi:hypothetical protein